MEATPAVKVDGLSCYSPDVVPLLLSCMSLLMTGRMSDTAPDVPIMILRQNADLTPTVLILISGKSLLLLGGTTTPSPDVPILLSRGSLLMSRRTEALTTAVGVNG
mmetsp:Transcript_50149/g.150968  ORF Transcript_50149/g.150968 Transcript_50149/m.150968 type:complete len:106 (-) Transcript_50149:348-665(-)